jgi:hypothetical protein
MGNFEKRVSKREFDVEGDNATSWLIGILCFTGGTTGYIYTFRGSSKASADVALEIHNLYIGSNGR